MKTFYSVSAVLIIVLIITASSFAQTQQWASNYSGLAPYNTLENTVIDNASNSYVTGEGRANSSSLFTSEYLAKFNNTGAFQWQRSITNPYPGPNNKGSFSRTSVLDNSGNVIIAGYVDSANSFFKGFIQKYSPAGDSIWGAYSGINDTLRYVKWMSMKMDISGNIYVAGYRYYLNSDFVKSFLVAKYNSAGVLQWIRSQKPNQVYDIFDFPFNLSLDISGNVFVSSTFTKTSSSTSDIYTFKLNSSGAFQWAYTYDGPASLADEFTSMTLDGSGDVYVEGYGTNISPNNKEITCYKLNGSTGLQQWAYRTRGNNSMNGDIPYKLTAGNSNDIYLTCSLDDNSQGLNGVLIKLNSNTGTESWRRTLASSGSSNDKYCDVKVVSPGIVYVLGSLNYNSPGATIITKKYNTAGDSLAAATINLPGVQNEFITGGPGNSILISGDFVVTSSSANVFLVDYSVTTGINPVLNSTPDKFSLSQNYPNPFNPTTKISFNIPQTSNVTLNIFDATGKMVRTLINDQSFATGTHELEFNASALSSGTYYYQITAGSFTETKKMIMVK